VWYSGRGEVHFLKRPLRSNLGKDPEVVLLGVSLVRGGGTDLAFATYLAAASVWNECLRRDVLRLSEDPTLLD